MVTGTAKATRAAVGLLLQSMAAERQELGFRNSDYICRLQFADYIC